MNSGQILGYVLAGIVAAVVIIYIIVLALGDKE